MRSRIEHKPLPALERLLEVLIYDPQTGDFTWLVSTTNKIKPGDKAGTLMKAGYVHIQVDGVLYLAHRLAWKISTGEDPGDAQVDHEDRCRSNNRRKNIRLAPNREFDNMQNRAAAKGVCWNERKQRWIAYVSAGGRQIHHSTHETEAEATLARIAAKAVHHQFHPQQVSA